MTKKMFRRRHPSNSVPAGEEGSALVELAVSLPLLSLMLLGAGEFARLAYASIEVVNGAHAAALYASTSQSASSDSGGIANAANSDAGNLAGANAISVTSITTACTCADSTYSPSSCSDNSTCINHNSSMITAVTVQTQSTFSPLIHVRGGALSFTLKGTSTQVVSNE
jgi:Flp pilus assembly protein TadG